MSTSYGKNIKMTVYGGSHDERIGVIFDGAPKGFTVNTDKLYAFLKRRAPGKNLFSTQRKEADMPEFLSGIDKCNTLTGETLHAIIRNTNQHSSDYDNTSFVPRPSHADFAARKKYGDAVDLRGGGHFSGRLTAPVCIIGGICLQYLETLGVKICAHLYSIGNVYDTPFDLANVSENEFDILKNREAFPTLSQAQGEKMLVTIDQARREGDSVGGIIECAIIGLDAGYGEHMYNGIENRISNIVFGIPAVKGIEFGEGFHSSLLKGSQNNDPFYTDGEKIFTKTNHSGGILGGMSNGMPIVFRAAMKPTPSIFKEQDSVNMVTMTPVKLNIKGRHDPCVAVRAIPVFEAAAAIAIYDILCDGK